MPTTQAKQQAAELPGPAPITADVPTLTGPPATTEPAGEPMAVVASVVANPSKSDQNARSAGTPGKSTGTDVAAPIPSDTNEEPKIVRLRRYLDARYEFRLDIVSAEIEYRPKKASDPNAPYTTLNENTLIVELYEKGFTTFVDQLKPLLRSSYVVEFDPIQAYFQHLPAWDASQPDIIAQLAGYVTANDQAWFLKQYKKMLVRAVACAIGAIPFNKQCFVLVGEQNDGKSSFIRFHVPKGLEKYYTEHIEFDNKDGKFALCENFIINLDDLADLPRQDINKCKAFFTTDTLKARRPFGGRPIRDKRRASFFGSANSAEFLTDETGNVRWLIMEIEGIQHDDGGPSGYGRNIDIDKVWAQAYALLKSGFSYQMGREDTAESERRNKGHMQVTSERELVMVHLVGTEPEADKAEFLMTGEITQRLLKHYDYKIKINGNNIGKALRGSGILSRSGRREGCPYPIKGYWVKMFTETEQNETENWDRKNKTNAPYYITTNGNNLN